MKRFEQLFQLLLIVIMTSILPSCSNYVSKIHKSLDQENNTKHYNRSKQGGDPFSTYRNKRYKRGRRRGAPRTYSKLSTKDQGSISPRIKRNYQPNKTRRYTTNDIADSKSDASLWSDNGQRNFLFSRNNRKRHGDIVTVNILSSLKKQISLELNNAFPVARRKKKKKDGGEKKKEEAPAPPSAAAQATSPEAANKVHDKIPSIVVEEIKDDYILLMGKKEILFKKRKHTIELQALVNRKDVSDDDSVMSSKILESTVRILR